MWEMFVNTINNVQSAELLTTAMTFLKLRYISL